MEQIVTAEPMIADSIDAIAWGSGLAHIASAGTYWLATATSQGRPHVMPVLAVVANGKMHFATGQSTSKGVHLRANQYCVLSASAEGFDLVLEGHASVTRDHASLQQVADSYAEKYGWHVTVRDGAFHNAEGAPTAGPPPFDVFAIEPVRAFAFGTSDQSIARATRWKFS